MNNKVKEYFNERTKRLFSLNRIRFYKMIEIVQLSITTFIVTVIAAKFFNKIFMGRKTSEEKEKELRKKSLLDLSISLCLELIIYCIVFFYIKKLVMIIPPLPLFLDSNFIPHHTVEYVMHMVFLLLIIELSSSLKLKIDVLVSFIKSSGESKDSEDKTGASQSLQITY